MAYREVAMWEILELLRRIDGGDNHAAITRTTGLRQRQLATNYNYFVYGGISYRFGSIFTNVVNPRMGGGSGGDVIIMM
jgi:hypothetical protein